VKNGASLFAFECRCKLEDEHYDEGTTNFRVSALASLWDLVEYAIQPASVYGPKPPQLLPSCLPMLKPSGIAFGGG
jgi:hypothetical protein